MGHTLLQLVQAGDVVRLIIMGVIFIGIGFMISRVGPTQVPKDTQPAAASQPDHKSGNMAAVTAAISAAVKTYKNK